MLQIQLQNLRIVLPNVEKSFETTTQPKCNEEQGPDFEISLGRLGAKICEKLLFAELCI